MPIRINTDLTYIQTKLNIPESRMAIYRDKTIEEILEAEAAAGNQKAVQMAADMFTDVSQLIELFNLADSGNKLVIMREMSSSQLEELVPMLDTNDLVEGLKFFQQDSLLNMLQDIPKSELVHTVFQMFSEQQIIKFMPEKELDKMLTDAALDKENILKHMQILPQIYVQQIIESVTGEEAKGSMREMIAQLRGFGNADFHNAIKNFEPTQKRELTYMLANVDNDLYEKFDSSEYAKIINRERDKNDLVKAMGVIKPEYLQRIIANLPQDLLAVVTTQIDTEKFADTLINKFPQLLAKFVAS